MRFPRCVRLDASDVRIFHRAAGPGEWAVPGGFAFHRRDPDALDRKDRIAFASGWLGTDSFGHCSLVEVAEIDEAGFFRVVERLARHFVEAHGAPDLAAALPAAREEADYAAGLCEHKLNTLLAVEREPGAEGIIERFRVIVPGRAKDHARIWEIVEDGED
jgi:hypothetical protein